MRKSESGKALRIVLGSVCLLTAGAGGALVVATSAYTPIVAPGTTVAGVPVGGLTKQEAAAKIDQWWSSASDAPLNLTAPGFKAQPDGFTAKSLDLHVDTAATLEHLPVEDFWANSSRKISGKKLKPTHLEPVIVLGDGTVQALRAYVDKNRPDIRPARADLVAGEVQRTPEIASYLIDEQGLLPALTKAALGEPGVALPLKKAAQKVPDEALGQIREVESSYTSHYNEGNSNRSSNIRNAARRLSGTILMPGQTFSFNGVLGRRTEKNGFKLAGVYNNGKHDVDIGGGICQVSGTLYNAVLLADLKIVSRSNHTFPVPYLPVGRDATVSYPAPDFAFQNSTDRPIAISASAGGGSLTFRILGQKVQGREVSLYTAGHQSWGRPEKVITDLSLPPGRRIVEEPGGSGHRIQTYRVVKVNGVEVKRESLGQSEYPGGARIVRINPKAPAPKAGQTKPPVSTPGDGTAPADTVPPIADPAGSGDGL